jgi:chromosome segregation ATPase
VTTKYLNEDKADHAGVHQECMTKASAYEAEFTSRAEELKALATAKKIIVEATSLAQTESFLQLRISSKGTEVVHMLKKLASEEKSKSLSQLASRAESALRIGTSSGEDPFAKIKEMTQDMIDKLESAQAADATQKAFCDKEMKETKDKKADKEAEVDKLATKKEQKEAQSAKLKEQVATLQKELSEIASAQAEATSLRSKEKAAVEAATPDLKKAIKGIQLALKTLKDYYSKAADAAHGASGASSGIIALLETAETDFIRNLNEMVAEEEVAAAAYESQTKENDLTKLAKEADVKYKTKEAVTLDKDASDLSTEVTGVQDELDAVNSAWQTLQSQCVKMPASYEERQKRREEEVARLKDTLEVFESEAALVQVSAKHLRGVRKHA